MTKKSAAAPKKKTGKKSKTAVKTQAVVTKTKAPKFAQMIRAAREAHNWSLREISVRTGTVSRQTAFRAEQGDASLATVMELGKLLDLNVADLMLEFNKHQLAKARAKNKAERESLVTK